MIDHPVSSSPWTPAEIRMMEDMRPGDHIAVDLDGVLAEDHGWEGPEHIGAPVPAMLARVKAWRADGIEVRIFTARVSYGDDPDTARAEEVTRAYTVISAWCWEYLGEVLPITCEKSYQCAALYDDRAYRVEANTGRLLSTSS